MNSRTKELAKYIIRLIEDKLRTQFGIALQLGAELEYTLKINDKVFSFPRDYKEAGNPLGKWIGDKDQKYRTLPGGFICYKEWGNFAYELVFNHTKPINADTSQGLLLGGEIESMKSLRLKNAIQRLLPAKAIEKIIFDPVSPFKYKMDDSGPWELWSQSLQLNISLHTLSGEPCNLSPSITNFNTYLSLRILEVLKECMVVIVPTSQSYKRLFEGGSTCLLNGELDVKQQQGSEGSEGAIQVREEGYIESRIAGADAEPYALIACHLIGIYYGLTRTEKVEVSNGAVSLLGNQQFQTREVIGACPKTKEEAVHLLEQGTIVKAVLNSLEAELGEKFAHALHEQSTTKKAARLRQ